MNDTLGYCLLGTTLTIGASVSGNIAIVLSGADFAKSSALAEQHGVEQQWHPTADDFEALVRVTEGNYKLRAESGNLGSWVEVI